MRVRSRVAGVLVGSSLVVSACTSATTTSSSTSDAEPSSSASVSASVSAAGSGSAAPADPALAAELVDLVTQFKDQNHLRAVLVRVTRGDDVLFEEAVGESMTGVPATTEMHFRNGAVAISYMSTLMLMLVDEGKVTLDDKVSTWLPDIPHSDEVTMGQLAQMTSGYVDYESTPELTAANYADPYKQWTP